MLARVAKYSAWQLIAQFLSAATMVVLTALLPASPLATYGYALSISSLMSSFITLRMEQAILVAGSEGEAANLAWASVIAAAVLMACFVAFDQLGVIREGRGIYTAGAISAFSMSLVTISQQVLIKKNRSEHAGRIAAVRSLTVSLAVVLFAYLGERVSAKSVLIGLSISSVIVALACIFELTRTVPISLKKGGFKESALSYFDIWGSYLGQSVLSGVSLNAPYFAIFHFAEHRFAAAFLLADRVVRMPVTLLSNSVRSHLTHQLRDLYEARDKKYGLHILVKWSSILAAVGAVLLIIGGFLVVSIGGYRNEDKWRLAGYAVLTMAMWGATVMSNSPATAVLTVCRKTGYILKAQAIELLSRILVIAFVVLFVLNNHFYLGLFSIFIPGVFYNTALWLKARGSWGAYAF